MDYIYKPAKYFTYGWGKKPVLIVVHWVAGSFNSCIRTFEEGLRQASAHFVISKNGDVVQMVDLKNRAWHAGKSETKDFGPYCNNYSIGIELEGPPSFVGLNGWNKEQIKSLVEVCHHIQKEIPTVQYITDHSTISPGRKIDVKGSTGNKVDIFPWAEFMNLAQMTEIK